MHYAAQIGVRPNEERDGRMIGSWFECVGHCLSAVMR